MAIDPKKQLPGGLKTVNEEFFDAMVRHQIGLMRLSGSIRNQIFELLDATEADVAEKVRRQLANHKGFSSPASVTRMEKLLKDLRSTRLKAWKDVNAIWVKELTELAKAEPPFVDGALKTVVPVVLETTLPSAEFLRQIVATKPFEGKTLRQWARNVAAADINRIEAQVKIGMVQGESSAAIARRIVGTVAQKGRNGVTQITRNNAATITRTAVNAVANQAKRAYYAENEDIFALELYVATLDNRTTLICSSLDGKKFPLIEGPIPPLHLNCRSLRVAVIDGDVLGKRPARPFTEKSLLKEFTDKEKLHKITTRAKLPRGFKGKFDEFSQGRIRDLTGRIPAKVDYQTWLGRQSVTFQNEVLGPTRGRLFRKGGLKLERFVNRAGDDIPLSGLARSAKKAFVAAGLDPEDFL
ncbi:minor capsid protein [Candidatus Pacearchaeota archaeon]|nr:minor capsid protein [Candidatus Pacearchaeota archaeon]